MVGQWVGLECWLNVKMRYVRLPVDAENNRTRPVVQNDWVGGWAGLVAVDCHLAEFLNGLAAPRPMGLIV
jgi:hypothetical protein